ncbi:MAG: hypothetical protein ACRD0G_06115 [Acidimicrobiales bacterium]
MADRCGEVALAVPEGGAGELLVSTRDERQLARNARLAQLALYSAASMAAVLGVALVALAVVLARVATPRSCARSAETQPTATG